MGVSYVLGVDGGGTKTSFELTDRQGASLVFHTDSGISYRQHGLNKVLETLLRGRNICARQSDVSLRDITHVCIGLPCWGESPQGDMTISGMIEQAFSPAKVRVVNDTEAAWAGSLSLQPGINVVSGTGSIAYGRDRTGRSARCGGWSEAFGDEGSCFWAGIKTMELFSKQSDGRLPRSALYDIVRRAFSLKDDMDFIDIMHREYIPFRDKTAQLQILLDEAASAGDRSAAGVYRAAAGELALLVKGARNGLALFSPFPVSYSGGMFKAGNLILPHFRQLVKELGGALREPEHPPVHGAVLLALELPGASLPNH